MNNRQRVAFLLVWGFLLFFLIQLFHNTKAQKAAGAWNEEWSEETAETSKAEKSQATEEVEYLNIYFPQTSPCLVSYAIVFPKTTAMGVYYAPTYRWPARAIWRLYSLFCNFRR